ncbi:MAG TPA: Spy/CpxP family protein refolding chaperone [Kamptonema sp.]|nr:Spy/CpxP family protein refolding chaperone [Kamptonema sp.]
MLLRRFSALGLLILSLGSTAAIAAPKLPQIIAQAPPEPGPPMRDGGQLFEKLNLTADQKQKIQTIRNQYQGQITQRREAMRQSQQELMSLMSGTASESQIREKHRQVLAQGQQMAEMQFEVMLAMRQVLTPEQRRQLAQMMQERRDVKNPNRGGNRPQ